METVIIIIVIFLISIVLAFRSSKDEGRIPHEISRLITARKHTGRIVFFEGKKTKHYSSSSSSRSPV